MTFFEPGSVISSFCDICVTVAALGCIFTLFEAAFVFGFAEEDKRRSVVQPPVTVLKPLHGAEPGLSARLAAYCDQNYGGAIQLVVGAQNETEPTVIAARAMKAQFPTDEIEIVVDARSHGANRKISNLINMLPRARHDTIVLSDSDIVVGADYLRGIAPLLAPARVGAATCLYYGIGDGLWSRLSALAINTHFLPQAITAASFGFSQHCCGATIALRRSMLDRIGGFAAFSGVLADDYAIGAAIRTLGYEVATAHFLVGHRCFEASLRDLVLHQIRIARTIRSIAPLGYAGTIVTHPWPLALLGVLSGGSTAVLVAAIAVISRLTLCRCVEWRFGLSQQNYWLVPLHDVVAFAVYVASFFGTAVHWQGSDYRVTADGALREYKAWAPYGLRNAGPGPGANVS